MNEPVICEKCRHYKKKDTPAFFMRDIGGRDWDDYYVYFCFELKKFIFESSCLRMCDAFKAPTLDPIKKKAEIVEDSDEYGRIAAESTRSNW